MARARRKMRRQLMKKMKKGYLTPGEREELKDLDREVNQLNRRTAREVGLGGAAALYAAKQTGALDKAGDALGQFLDERQAKRDIKRADKEARGLADAQADIKEMQLEELMASLPQDSPDPSKRQKKKNMKAVDDLVEFEEEEDFVDEELDADLAKYKEDRMKDLEQGLENNAALASMFGQYDAPKTFDELTADANKGINTQTPGGKYYNRSYTGDEVDGPTAEDAWVNSAESPYDLVRGESTQDFSQGPRATEGRDIIGPNGPVGPPMELGTMIDLGGRGNKVDPLLGDLERNPGPINFPPGTTVLPEVEVQANGGYAPFLRSMRDRMRKKYIRR